MHRLLRDLRNLHDIKSSFLFGDTFHVTFHSATSDEELRGFLEDKGHSEIEIQTIQPTVEDCFMLLSKKV